MAKPKTEVQLFQLSAIEGQPPKHTFTIDYEERIFLGEYFSCLVEDQIMSGTVTSVNHVQYRNTIVIQVLISSMVPKNKIN